MHDLLLRLQAYSMTFRLFRWKLRPCFRLPRNTNQSYHCSFPTVTSSHAFTRYAVSRDRRPTVKFGTLPPVDADDSLVTPM